MDRRNLALYVVCRFPGLIGKRLDLGGDNGKASAGFTGTRRLDRRIQGEEVGLAGDIRNDLHDTADPLRCARQSLHRGCGAVGLLPCELRDFIGAAGLLANLTDRA